MVSVRAPVGRLNKARTECCVGRGLAAIQSSKCPSPIYYALPAAEACWIPYEPEGTIFWSISGPSLKAIEILVPPSAEELEPHPSALDDSILQLANQTNELQAL